MNPSGAAKHASLASVGDRKSPVKARSRPMKLKKAGTPSAKEKVDVKAENGRIHQVGKNIVVPDFLGMQPKLEFCSLQDNLIRNISFLGYLPKLVVLDLGFNEISHLEPESLDLPCLRELYLNNNLIESIAGLPRFPKLQVLSLSTNLLHDLSGATPQSSLKMLFLSRNMFASLSSIHAMAPRLEVLSLKDNPIAEEVDYYNQAVDTFADLRQLDETDLLAEEPSQPAPATQDAPVSVDHPTDQPLTERDLAPSPLAQPPDHA